LLDKIEIKRFKTIKNLNLSFGKVNLFIGGNGSGKSNILESIGLASSCLGRGLSDVDLRLKGVRLTPPELMKSSFKNEDLPSTFHIKVNLDKYIDYSAVISSREEGKVLSFFTENCKYLKESVFGRSNRGATATGVAYADRLDKQRGLWDQIKATYDIPNNVVESFNEFAKYAIFSPQTDFLRGKKSGDSNLYPIGLHGEGLMEALITFGKEHSKYREINSPKEEKINHLMSDAMNLVWLPGWASMVSVKNKENILTSNDMVSASENTVVFKDRFMHRMRNFLSVYDSSEGTLFLLFSAMLLSHPNSPRIFAFDNVDNALNPKLTKSLVSKIIEITKYSTEENLPFGAKQVFMTSHNPTSLDAFDLFDDDQRVFVVKRNDKGHTIATRLQPANNMTRDDWEVAKAGRNLSQLWIDGEIDGAYGEI